MFNNYNKIFNYYNVYSLIYYKRLFFISLLIYIILNASWEPAINDTFYVPPLIYKYYYPHINGYIFYNKSLSITNAPIPYGPPILWNDIDTADKWSVHIFIFYSSSNLPNDYTISLWKYILGNLYFYLYLFIRCIFNPILCIGFILPVSPLTCYILINLVSFVINLSNSSISIYPFLSTYNVTILIHFLFYNYIDLCSIGVVII